MAEEERREVQQRERARGALRAIYLGEASSIGLKRAEALRVAEEELDKLARLLPNAIDAGISISEIARVADVSRPTLYELRARYTDNWRYGLLGVLQATLEGGSSTEIAERIGRPSAEVEALLNQLEDQEFVFSEEVEYVDGAKDWIWRMSMRGLTALEEWTLDENEGEGQDGG